MLHSGVFVGRQYEAFAGITHGQKIHDFLEKLLIRRLVTPIELGSTGRTRIFHVHHKPLYAAIGEPDNRNRRRVTINRVIERLMVLDGVLADRSVTWLGSEREKRRYFNERLGDRLRDDEYLRLVFGEKPNVAVRYFPDKLPIGYDRDHRRHVFMYLARSPSPMDFRVFILRHLERLNSLGFWTVRVLFPRSLAGAMKAYEKAAYELLTKPLPRSETEELIWFFRQPELLALAVSASDRARVQAARRAFRSPRFAAIRRHWIAEGNRAVFLAASPVARDTLDRQRASVECLELPHAYEQLFVLARKAARRKFAKRGDEALGMSGPLPRRTERLRAPTLVAIVATAASSELLMIQNVVAMVDIERAAFFAARSQGADLSAQRTGAWATLTFRPPTSPQGAGARVAHAPLSICSGCRRLWCPSSSFASAACHVVVARLAGVILETNLRRPADATPGLASVVVRATITHPSFELCSAPCKARRFAPPTRVPARGLRAWTAPARSSPEAI